MASEEEPPTKRAKVSSSQDDILSKVLEDIKVCQEEIDKLNENASEEILQIEQKYNKIRKPFFVQRNEHFKKIHRFWITAMKNHKELGIMIKPEEEDCLNYINDVVAEEFEDIKVGYKISFYFDENPYFENTVLTKIIYIASSADVRSEFTPIKWKENGKGLIYIKRYARSYFPTRFFDWITNSKEWYDRAESDEIAEAIKEDIWPSPLQFYMNSRGKNGDMNYYNFNDSCEEECEEEETEETPDESESEDEDDKPEELTSVNEIDSIAETEVEHNLSGADEQEPAKKPDSEPLEQVGGDTAETTKDSSEVLEETGQDKVQSSKSEMACEGKT